MSKKAYFQLIVLFILVVGAFVGIYLLRSSQDIREKAAPSTSLSMTTDSSLIHPGQSFSINVNATPGSNQVIGVQLDIHFDPRFINVSDVTLGTFLPGQVDVVKKEIDNVAGTILYVVWINPTTRVYATTPGLVATIVGSAPLQGSVSNTVVSFGTNTLVAALEDPGNNVVQNLTNLNLVVGTPTPTPTNTPTPTRTPTPTPITQSTVTFSPLTGTYSIGNTIQTQLLFNTHNVPISGVALSVYYPYSGVTPEVTVTGITVNPTFTSDPWTCPTQNATQQGGNVRIDIACANLSANGYLNNSDTLLATLNLRVNSYPAIRPLVLRYDAGQSIITSKATSQNILAIPTAATSYTITAPTNTPTPSPTRTPTPTFTNTPTPTNTPSPTPTANLNPPLCGSSTIPLNPGVAPLTVTLHGAGNAGSGTGFDGYRWDFENDGVWDTAVLANPVTHTYNTPGTYNPKFQVHGTNGVWSSVCNYPFNVVVYTPTPTFTPTATYTPTPTCILGSPVFMMNTINPQPNIITNSLTNQVQIFGRLSSLNSCGNPSTLEFWRGLPDQPAPDNVRLCTFSNPLADTEYLCEMQVDSGTSNTWSIIARHTDRQSTVTRIVRIAYPGDCDVNGVVDIIDYGILYYNFAKTDFDRRADVNDDRSVDIIDYSFIFYNFGKSV